MYCHGAIGREHRLCVTPDGRFFGVWPGEWCLRGRGKVLRITEEQSELGKALFTISVKGKFHVDNRFAVYQQRMKPWDVESNEGAAAEDFDRQQHPTPMSNPFAGYDDAASKALNNAMAVAGDEPVQLTLTDVAFEFQLALDASELGVDQNVPVEEWFYKLCNLADGDEVLAWAARDWTDSRFPEPVDDDDDFEDEETSSD
jgi:hypothetical protein